MVSLDLLELVFARMFPARESAEKTHTVSRLRKRPAAPMMPCRSLIYRRIIPLPETIVLKIS